MATVQLVLMCLLSSAVGDISEKIKSGQSISGPGPLADINGLLAPFNDGQLNRGRPSGIKGGRPSGVKGAGVRQVGSGAVNSATRVPIPFHNHDGDDDENNLDRLCNDAFHSFLCKPVGPRKIRFDGKLRPGAQLPPGFLRGSSSNVQITKELPTQSGGALLPTSLDSDDGYQYPKPSNVVTSTTDGGYTYPKPGPDYHYEKPANQLAYPSQVSNIVAKPSNEYLPSFRTASTTTLSPPTLPLLSNSPTTSSPLPLIERFPSSSNQILSQSNSQPPVATQFYQYPKPSNPILLPTASQSLAVFNPPVMYSFPQTTLSTYQPFSTINTSPNPALNVITYSSTKPAIQFPLISSPTIAQPSYVYTALNPTNEVVTPTFGISHSNFVPHNNDNGYYYPKPSNDNPVIIPTVQEPSSVSTSLPVFPPNNGYLPPAGVPVPKASNVIFNSLPTVSPLPTFATFRNPAITNPYIGSSVSTTQRPFLFQSTTRAPLEYTQTTPAPPPITSTFRTTTPSPVFFSSTFRPVTFRTSVQPPVSVTTPRPAFSFATTLKPNPTIFYAAPSNEVAVPAFQPVKPSSGYLPSFNQPIPSSANDFKNVLPFNLPSTIKANPTPPPTTTPQPPSKEYLPQIDVRFGSSSNLSPNIEGGALLAEEADAPTPDVIAPKSKERTHTLEELCRDAFHSFLCKPITMPRKRIDGRIREGAKIPPHVLIGAGSSPLSSRNRIPNQSGGALLSSELNPSSSIKGYPRYQPNGPPFQSTNVHPQYVNIPTQYSPSIFLLSASDSSSLAKKFSHSMSPNTLSDYSTSPQKTNTLSTKTSEITNPDITTVRPITNNSQSSTSQSHYSSVTTIKPSLSKSKKINLQTSATGVDPTRILPSSSQQSVKVNDNKGYSYPKPSKPLTYPTTGYNYPKPSRPLTLPTTQKPRTTKPTSIDKSTFGQRLRPLQSSQGTDRQKQLLQSQQQEHLSQAQFQEDPFDQNDVALELGLPPASQFEIIKP